MELLQGCRDEREWRLLETYPQDQDYIEPTPNTWVAAARIHEDCGTAPLSHYRDNP